MSIRLLMGNEAIAYGAIRAGVQVVTGYPGTPSSEILETVAKNNNGDIYVEWSVNEKSALEVAAGAAYSGARVMVTMKQVGLNVAADPIMSLNYVGVEGGMVVVVTDDPGPISSQTEQDTRHFGQFSKIMVFDPSTPQEAYEMIADAFEYSEKYKEPVFLRPTTRVCHAYQSIEVKDERKVNEIKGFEKNPLRWVIFPKLSFNNHKLLEDKLVNISKDFSKYKANKLVGSGKKGIAAGGVSYEYVKEILGDRNDVKLLKISTPNPFPYDLANEFLTGLDEVLVAEELDPVIEKELTYLCGKKSEEGEKSPIIKGKLSRHTPNAGENSVENLRPVIERFLNDETYIEQEINKKPQLPVRPPVLCAGCPHRASFYAVKKAMVGKEAVFSGDIGCYTLGNASPLNMVDTCLCMGAGITIAQGLGKVAKDVYQFAFIGDSTFFASGITGVVNAVYNEANITVVILDNSTTAMTGHQPHPGTGRTMMGNIVDKIDIVKILKAIGLTRVETVNPLELEKSVETVKSVANEKGVKAIIFKSPCIALTKKKGNHRVDETKCINCKKCINEIGCPAIIIDEGKVKIDNSLCTSCGLCEQICPVGAIGGNKNEF